MAAPPRTYTKLRASWVETLDRIEPSVIDLYHNRNLWRQMMPALTAREYSSSAFVDHYNHLYTTSAAMTVRRLARSGRNDKHSLGALLDKLTEHSDALSWGWFRERLSTWGDEDTAAERLVRRSFERWSNGADTVDPALIAANRAALTDAAAKVVAHADESIAHVGAGSQPNATYLDLDQAIDFVGDTFKRYYGLLNAASYQTLAPYISGDWAAPFRRPLFD